MKQDELVSEDDFVFGLTSQWKCPLFLIFQLNCEITPYLMKSRNIKTNSY